MIEKETKETVVSGAENELFVAASVSLRGLSHVRGKIPLQDYSKVFELGNDWLVAVIADGVGSEPYSDVGSKTAVDAFERFLISNCGFFKDEKSILDLLKAACINSVGKMNNQAKKLGHELRELSTTLHAAILTPYSLYYAHAGDGGIIAMLSDGEIVPVTSPHKAGDFNEYVVPLTHGPKNWEFGVLNRDIQSVLLCTDGVYDKLCNRLYKKFGYEVDKAMSSVFLSPWATEGVTDPEVMQKIFHTVFRGKGGIGDVYTPMAHAIAQSTENEEVQKAARFISEKLYLNEEYHYRMMRNIDDDITVAVIQRRDVKPFKKPNDFYLLPDFKSISEMINKDLYGE